MPIVGHWANLAEAQKLVQSKLLAGVVQEVIEEGQLLPMLPVFAICSLFLQSTQSLYCITGKLLHPQLLSTISMSRYPGLPM